MNRRFVIVSLLFQGAWFGLVLLGNQSIPYVLLVVTLVWILAIQSFGFKMLLSLLVAVLGSAIDAVNAYLSVLRFSDDELPAWLMVLWALFSGYAVYLIDWIRSWPIKRNHYVGLLLFMLGGPASYLAAIELGAAELGRSFERSVAILALEWLVIYLVVSRIVFVRVVNYVDDHSN